MRLGELLVRENLVTLEQLRRAQTRSRKKVALALVETGAVDERALVRVVSKFHNIPAVALDAYTAVDADLPRLVPREVCEQLDALPLRHEGDKLVVAVVDPSNVAALDDIRFLTGCELSLVVTSPRDMQHALAQYGPPPPPTSATATTMTAAPPKVFARVVVDEPPIAKLVNVILNDMQKRRATDAIFEPRVRELTVWYRVNGELIEILKPPYQLLPALERHLQELAGDSAGDDCGAFVHHGVDVGMTMVPSRFGTQTMLTIYTGQAKPLGRTDVADALAEALRTVASDLRVEPGVQEATVQLKRRRDGAWISAWTYPMVHHATAIAALARTPLVDVKTDACAAGTRLLARAHT